MNNSPQLFIYIGDLEIFLITRLNDEQNNIDLIEKLILPIDFIRNNRILDLDNAINLIKKNILIIEQKVNYTFKDIIVILNNFEISFVNLCGFKKLNGAQIVKENITYIINSLKSCVEEFEKNKKILHIFNSEYCLDKKKLNNLPIGLFGNFYSHELSFNLINRNDFKNLENIFKQCNLKIKKILLESFVKGSLISDQNTKTETFFYIQINKQNSKIFYIENNSIKYEQKFNFGTEIILSDIRKITSLGENILKKIFIDNTGKSTKNDFEILEEKYFKNLQYRKIKKKLIFEIAEARINELRNLFYLNNINFKKFLKKVSVIFLEVDDRLNANYFCSTYENSFACNKTYEVKIIEKPSIEEITKKAYDIVQFGWKKEAIPVVKLEKSLFSKIFRSLFY